MYWDIYRTLSHNGLWNFIFGNRGSGKTYGFKKWAIDDFLKNGQQFVYVRRYKQEFSKIKTFFSDIEERYPDTRFEVKGGTFRINNQVAGFYMPLSTSKIEKSTAYPKVNKICFDEFVLDKGVYYYLPNEVEYFLELYETIARMRDNVRVLFLSNAITMMNPYTAYFNLTLPFGDGNNFAKFKQGLIVLELVRNKEFIEKKKQTRFGKLVEGTPYGDYAIDNEFLRDNDNFIQKKTPDAKHYCVFIHTGVKYGVWVDYKQGLYIVSKDYDPDCDRVYALTTPDHTINTVLHNNKAGGVLHRLLNEFKLGNMRFESPQIKGIMYQVLKTSY